MKKHYLFTVFTIVAVLLSPNLGFGESAINAYSGTENPTTFVGNNKTADVGWERNFDIPDNAIPGAACLDPIAYCRDTTVYLDAGGKVRIDSSFIDDGSTYDCGLASMVLDITEFNCADVGENTVELTVTDINGIFSTCNATVTVADTIPPDLLCPKDFTTAADPGVCNAIVNYELPKRVIFTGSFTEGMGNENCGKWRDFRDQLLEDLTYSKLTIKSSLDAVGKVLTDADNIKGIADALREGTDTLVVEEGVKWRAGMCGASVELSVGIRSDLCTCEDEYTLRPCIGDANWGGVGTSTCNAPSQIITVEFVIASGDGGNVAYDNCDNTPTVTQIAGLPSGSEFPVGTTTNTFVATDEYGNESECSFNIVVLDTISPTVFCKDTSIYLAANGKASIDTSFVYVDSDDACGIASVTLSKTTFYGSNTGVNLVNTVVADVNGNVSSCTSKVTIMDTIAPVALCRNVGVTLDTEGKARIYPYFIDKGSTDEGGIVYYGVSMSRFNCSNVGENTVVLTVRDAGGNVSTCSSIVTVNDRHAPVAVCKDIDVFLEPGGIVEIDPDMIDNGSTDLCGITGMELSQSIFTGDDIGENMVTLSVTDVGGNTANCEAKVTVIDKNAPVAMCNSIDIWLTDSAVYTLSDQDIFRITEGSSDNATPYDSLQIEISPTTFDCSNVGDSVTVDVVITDGAGNETGCEAMVYVHDSTQVLLNSIEDIEITLAAGVCETTIDYPELNLVKPCATFAQLEGLGADGIFPLGTTTETWEVLYSNNIDTVSFSVIIASENAAPTIENIPNVSTNEDTPVSVSLSGISGGMDCEEQSVSIVAAHINNTLVTDIEVEYTPGDTTGKLNIALAENGNGTDTISVVVEDTEGAKTTKIFALDVISVNDAPVLLTMLEDVELNVDDIISLSINTLLGTVFDDADDTTLVFSAMLDEGELPSWITVTEEDDLLTLNFDPSLSDTACYNVVIEATDPEGAMVSDTFELCLKKVMVGINDLSDNIFDVKMYPNPTKGMVTVGTATSSFEETQVAVMNIAGSEVFRKIYRPGEDIRFNLSEQVSGVYLVFIELGNQRVVKKLILDRK